jgi:hypothetical protein
MVPQGNADPGVIAAMAKAIGALMSEHSERPARVISPDQGSIPAYLEEVWANRDLVAFLVWRDIKVRYRQTFFGGRLGRGAAHFSPWWSLP